MAGLANATSRTLDLRCAAQSPLHRLDFISESEPWEVHVEAGDSAWLEIEERGVWTQIHSPDGDIKLQAEPPPRYGRGFVAVKGRSTLTVGRLLRGGAPGEVLIRLECEPDAAQRRLIDWFEAIGKIAPSIASPLPPARVDAALTELKTLADSGPDRATRALGKHLIAQTLLLAGRSSAASEAFAQAERAWVDAGDRARALAARVGRVEDLQRSGQYQQVLTLASNGLGDGDASSYYAVRLQTSRCLALRYLGRMNDADACYQVTLPRLEKLNERNELAGNLQDFADVKRFRGHNEEAESLGRRTIALTEGPYAPIIRGRTYLMFADIELERGNVIGALNQIDAALREFDLGKAPRWTANAMLIAASIYTQLDALREANDFVARANTLLSPKDAPARVAAALVTQSRIDERLAHLDDAWNHLLEAERLYRGLSMPMELEAARAGLARVALQKHDPSAASDLIGHQAANQPFYRVNWRLTEVGLNLEMGRADKARALLASLARGPLSLADQVEVSRLTAESWILDRKFDTAMHTLLVSAQRLEALARSTDNPILGYMLTRRLSPLRATAGRVILAQFGTANSTPSPYPEAALGLAAAWLETDDASPVSRANVRARKRNSGDVGQFDQIVARDLFPSKSAAPIGDTATRKLISILSDTQGLKALPPTKTLQYTRIQKALGPHAAFAGHLDAGTRGLILWITRDRIGLYDAPSAQTLESRAKDLQALLSSPNSTTTSIAAAVDGLSHMVLDALPLDTPPDLLLIHRDSALAAIPWSVLHLRDHSNPLVATTATSLVSLRRASETDLPQEIPRLSILTSAQPSPDQTSLPNALVEPQLIATATRSMAPTLKVVPRASRDDILASLVDEGAWVHVAAHGYSQPDRIGYSGVWLGAKIASDPPEFLSWLDVLMRGSRTELVVLDACQLGASAETARASLGFSAAVSRAGARNVVAALWPVSDAAAGTWVSSFYSALAADPGRDSAMALRVAQYRLTETRAFRHPFYWASLVHFGHLDVGASPGNPMKAAESIH